MYREGRYCQHLTQPELNQRVRDIFIGCLRTNSEAKIGLGPMDDMGMKYMELWTHVLEEMAIRHGPYPGGFTRDILHSEPFPDFVGDLSKRTAALLSNRKKASGDFLIRFGKQRHMRALFDLGHLRISPASYYAKPTHNGAVRDDEMALPISLSLSRDHVLRMVSNPQDVPADLVHQRVDVQYRVSGDYWIYCLTEVAESRLFVDFEADACVVITNKKEFTRRLLSASSKHFGGTKFRAGRVQYIDPLLPKTAKINVPHSKHFRYEYQSEYRYVWIPARPSSGLSHVDIELGSLADIAEIVVANPSLGA